MTEFKKQFLATYLAGGMGALSKRDIDALVMHLLDEHGVEDGKPLRNLSNQQVSLKLRAPVSRIKSLRYEATLKHVSDQEKELLAQWRFLEILARARFEPEKDRISFIIEDAFTKNWLQAVLKDNGLVFDNSFNTEIIKVDSDGLLEVLKILYDERSVSTLKKRIEDTKAKKEKLSFADIKKEFLKSAAGELGSTVTGAAIKGLLSLVGG